MSFDWFDFKVYREYEACLWEIGWLREGTVKFDAPFICEAGLLVLNCACDDQLPTLYEIHDF